MTLEKTLQVQGMTCTGCEVKIENKIKKISGVKSVKASSAKGNVLIFYDTEEAELLEIIDTVESIGYTVVASTESETNDKVNKSSDIKFLLGISIVLFAVYVLIQNTIGFNFIPTIDQNMGLGILFIIGLFTSLHCISMCGGINLSQCVAYNANRNENASKLKPSIMYNAGRVISYTIIGGIVGAIGSVISFGGAATGLVSIIAGVFMLIMGLNMMNVLPNLRRFMPRIPKFIGNKLLNSTNERKPFYIGLLNGFMPCGPLQTMQIFALGTGSALMGAMSMFAFSMGTVPLMFGLGAVSTLLSSKFTKNMMKVSAALVMVLGFVMLNRGLSLSGIDMMGTIVSLLPEDSVSAAVPSDAAIIRDDVQYVSTTFTGRSYAPITVQAGIPVVWTIDVQQLNGCNNPIQIRDLDMRIDLSLGENVVEFTPNEAGIISYSCWMGMIRSRIIVVDELETADTTYIDENDIEFDYYIEESYEYTDILSMENVQVAEIVNDIQEITISIKDGQFFTDVIVLQADKEFIIHFDLQSEPDLERVEDDWIYASKYFVNFPIYQGGIDLTRETTTPRLPIIGDFIFGDIFLENLIVAIIVDDVSNFDEAAVIVAAEEFMIEGLFGDGFACH